MYYYHCHEILTAFQVWHHEIISSNIITYFMQSLKCQHQIISKLSQKFIGQFRFITNLEDKCATDRKSVRRRIYVLKRNSWKLNFHKYLQSLKKWQKILTLQLYSPNRIPKLAVCVNFQNLLLVAFLKSWDRKFQYQKTEKYHACNKYGYKLRSIWSNKLSQN